MAINYGSYLPNPNQAMQTATGLANLDQARLQNQQVREQKEAQAAQQAKIKELLPKVQAGDYDATIEMTSISPEIGQAVQTAKANMKEGQDRMTAEWIAGYQASPDKEAYLSQDNTSIDIDDQFRQMPEEQRDVLTKIVGSQVMPKQMFEATFSPPKQAELQYKDGAVFNPATGEVTKTALYQEGGNAPDAPATVRETEWFLKQTPEVQSQHLKLKRKTDPTMAQKLEQKQKESDIAVEEASRKEGAKSTAARQQGFIDSGVEAADSLGNAYQVRSLLDSVETGGFDAAALRAKQLFGIESGDEAQLSAGLGKAILSQLKPIFGAAFTAAEGERLERIEANFGKSTAGNKRLINEVIKITERAAKRGIRAANAQGDKFAADEIKSALDSLKGDGPKAKTETIKTPEVEAEQTTVDLSGVSDEELSRSLGL